jgi:hypothetical protein
MLYNLLEFVYKYGIEAFNLLNLLPSYLLNFFLFSLDPPQKLLIKGGHALQP